MRSQQASLPQTTAALPSRADVLYKCVSSFIAMELAVRAGYTTRPEDPNAATLAFAGLSLFRFAHAADPTPLTIVTFGIPLTFTEA